MPDASPRLRFREIRSEDDRSFRAAYRLLRRIFPRSEMLPRADWVQVMRERRAGLWTDTGWHLLVAERGGEVIGAASGSYIGSINIGLIGYVAVARAERASGLGPKLRDRLRRAFERDAAKARGRKLDGILGEVREDNPWLRTLVKRDGAIALDFPYYQPSLGAHHEAVALVLYYQPIARPRTFLMAAEVRRLLYAVWRRSYRVGRPLKRPAFKRMMKALRGRRRIGQRKLPAKTSRH